MKTQTDSKKYEGQCKFCKRDFTKREIVDHLDVCPERKKDEKIKNLRLRIVDSYIKDFWLIVEINNQAKLKDLDKLIRDVWVECCGHLSLFGNYGAEIGKGRIIMGTLSLGDSLNYIYDFGSSTELTIEVLGCSNYQLNDKKNIELVARNYLPMSNCQKCGKQALWTCVACVEEEEEMALVCDECAEKYHNEEKEGEEHYLLPLANSPRCGVCGYEPPDPLDKLF
jgi:hypothetical protein